jgi:hypothetical protein
MAVVEVDAKHRCFANLLEATWLLRSGAPQERVEIPASLLRVKGDSVAHSTCLRLCGHLVAAVGESNGAGEPVTATGPIGEILKVARQSKFQPLLARVPADRHVATEHGCLAIGTDEQALGVPTLAPFPLAQAGGVEIVARLCETTTASTDSNAAIGDLSFDLDEPMLEYLKSALPFESLGSCRVTTEPAPPRGDWHGEPFLNALDLALKAPSFS